MLVGVAGADVPPGKPNVNVDGLAVPADGAVAPNANAGVAGDAGNPLVADGADPNALVDGAELPALKPTMLNAGEAAGKGLAGVGKALVGVGLGWPNGLGVGCVNGFEGEAVAEGVCPNPAPDPNVNAGVVDGAAAVPPVLNPLPPPPNPLPALLLLEPNANGAGLAGVADPNPFDCAALVPFNGPPNGPPVELVPFVLLPNANPVDG